MPETRIGYIAIKPSPAREKYLDRIKAANHLIHDYTDSDAHLLYVDVFSPMLSSNGTPRPDLFLKDGLHPNAHGYEIWVRVIRPILDRYGPQPPPR